MLFRSRSRGARLTDNRRVRVLADRGAVLGACLLMALVPGAVGAAEVVWLLLAVVGGGLCAVADGSSSKVYGRIKDYKITVL